MARGLRSGVKAGGGTWLMREGGNGTREMARGSYSHDDLTRGHESNSLPASIPAGLLAS